MLMVRKGGPDAALRWWNGTCVLNPCCPAKRTPIALDPLRAAAARLAVLLASSRSSQVANRRPVRRNAAPGRWASRGLRCGCPAAPLTETSRRCNARGTPLAGASTPKASSSLARGRPLAPTSTVQSPDRAEATPVACYVLMASHCMTTAAPSANAGILVLMSSVPANFRANWRMWHAPSNPVHRFPSANVLAVSKMRALLENLS